jgi:hypothetical protein
MADILISQALEIRLNANLDKQLTILQSAIDDRISNLTNICCNQQHEIHQLHCKFEDRMEMLQRTLSEIARTLISAMDSDLSRKHTFKRSSETARFMASGLVPAYIGESIKDISELPESGKVVLGHQVSEPAQDERNMRILLPFLVEWRSIALHRQRRAKNNVKERMGSVIRNWKMYAPTPRHSDTKGATDSSNDGENSKQASDNDSAPSDFAESPSILSSFKCRRKGMADLVSCRRMFGDADDESSAHSYHEDLSDSGHDLLYYFSLPRLAEVLFGISGPNVWLGHNGSRAVHPNSPFAAGPPSHHHHHHHAPGS